VLLDAASGEPVVPNGSMGFRYADSGVGRWNLDLAGVAPALSIRDVDANAEAADVLLPCFEAPDGSGSVLHRGVPVRRIGDRIVTTVFDLMLAHYGVARPDLPGDWPTGYDDSNSPYTPAWQAEITSVPAEACIRIAREFATNAEQSKGRSMIIMGAGICQWFHADATYRSILSLLILTGSMGRNGGGWAHYVGQEKCRPITGWISLANALDWSRPPRTMIGTAYWYMHTDQWRFDGYAADALTSPLAEGIWLACTPLTQSLNRRGWDGCRSIHSSMSTRWSLLTKPRLQSLRARLPTPPPMWQTRWQPARSRPRSRTSMHRRTGRGR
jgi:nitrate reductase alpha subunit